MAQLAVVGATSWGVTLSWLLSRTGHNVTLVTRRPDEAAKLNRTRTIARMPELTLPPSVAAVAVTALGGDTEVEAAVIAVPAQNLRLTLTSLPHSWRERPILSAAKGIELASGRLMHAVTAEEGWPSALVAALSGPNLAHEIARGAPAASVVACPDARLAERWQVWLGAPGFRVYRSTDVIGVEVAGALKNVIAIAAGAAFQLGLGSNGIATLVTRGLAELTRLGVAMGGQPETFSGLAGLGDLCATCYSDLSRNRRLGELIAAGQSPAAALAAIREVVEGAATAPVARRLAESLGIDMPITAAVCEVLEGRATPEGALAALMGRPLVAEVGA